MDHLPYPGSATDLKKIIVPYVCQEAYDGGDFLTYPSRRGNLPNLHTVGPFPGQLLYSHQVQLASLSKSDIESFYQTWLFFGLIHEILGSLYVPEDFISTCEDQCGYTKAVSTSKFMPALEEWVARVQMGRVDPSVTYAHIAQCLCLTHAALSIQAIHAVGSNFDPTLKLSLASLGQTLTYAANAAFSIKDTIKDNRCPLTWRKLIDDGYWNGRLLARGWCMNEIKLIFDSVHSLQTLHFLACIDKTKVGQNHQACDTQRCMVYQNDLSEYQTQHFSKNCSCADIPIDQEALYAILKTKALPLIRVRLSQTLEDLSVDIVASTPTSRYVALSHVWADGLGNPFANALPRCQLLNIGKMIQGLNMELRPRDDQNNHVKERDSRESEELLLWCDTLCCPVQPKGARDLGLEHMHRTYRDATYVLVLDASLRHCDINSLGIDEVSMRILTSPWMRRLWTLQEGALPASDNKLWFQLANKALNIRLLRLNAYKKHISTISRKGLAGDIILRTMSFADVFMKDDGTEHPEADLVNVMRALRYRSVSVPSDEPLLIGNLLGIDISQILSCNGGAVSLRMNQLWRMIASGSHGIPTSLLFRPGPRLAEPGLRWAPATFLIDYGADTAYQSSESESVQAILTTSDGLLVHLHGYRLSLASRVKGLPSHVKPISQRMIPNRLLMVDDAGAWYLVNRNMAVKQDSFLPDKSLAEIVQESENPWVLYPGSEFPRQPGSHSSASIGLVVDVKYEEGMQKGGQEKAVKKGRAKAQVHMSPAQSSMQAWFAAAAILSAQLDSESPTLRKLRAESNGLDELSSSSLFVTTALEDLATEIHQLAMNKQAKDTIEAAGNAFSILELEGLITTMVWGQYVCMRETVPRTQSWCVD